MDLDIEEDGKWMILGIIIILILGVVTGYIRMPGSAQTEPDYQDTYPQPRGVIKTDPMVTLEELIGRDPYAVVDSGEKIILFSPTSDAFVYSKDGIHAYHIINAFNNAAPADLKMVEGIRECGIEPLENSYCTMKKPEEYLKEYYPNGYVVKKVKIKENPIGVVPGKEPSRTGEPTNEVKTKTVRITGRSFTIGGSGCITE